MSRGYRAGRDSDEAAGRVKIDVEPPAGDIFLGDRELWVEGSIIVYEEDQEMLDLRTEIREKLRLLSTCRRDEALNLLPGALSLEERIVPRDAMGLRPRRCVSRRGWDNRMSAATFHHVLMDHPGRTLAQLAVELYPNGTGDPKLREGSLRVTLHRLRVKGLLEIRCDPDGTKRYYPLKVADTTGPNQQRRQLLTLVLLGYPMLHESDRTLLVTQLLELFDHNRQRPDDAWNDPRGELKTAHEKSSPFDGAIDHDEDPF